MIPFLAAALGLTFVGSFLFSGVETGFYSVNRIRLLVRAESGDRSARRVLGLLGEPTLLLTVVLIGNNLVNFAASTFSQELLRASVHPGSIVFWNTLLLSPVLFVLGEITPKDCFRRRADTWVPRVAPLFVPLVRLASAVQRFILRRGRDEKGDRAGSRAESRAESRAVSTRLMIELSLKESAEDGVLSGDQGRLVSNILALRETRLQSVARTIRDRGYVASDGTVDDAVAIARDGASSRVLVIDRARGEPVGQVILHELVGLAGDDPVASRIRPVVRLTSDMTAMRALLLLRSERHGLAVVTEGGQAVGVVTVKDLAEEVVGDLPGW